MNIKKWLSNNAYSLAGKTVAITGSTGGLGFEICKHLANLDANMIFINRNKEKSEQQKLELLKLNPNISIEIIVADLSDFENTKQALEKMKTYKLDYLILNAGVYNIARFKTDAGYDNVFHTNFVSNYYLIKQLLPNLKNSNIIILGSIAHNYSKIDETDIDFSSRKKASKVYGNSKRFLMFSLMKLLKTNNINFSIVHPGITLTQMTNHYPKAINWLVKIGIKILFPSPKVASLNIIKGMFESTSSNEWIGPSIFNIWGKPKKQKLKTCSESEQEKIFNIAENIYEKLKNSGK